MVWRHECRLLRRQRPHTKHDWQVVKQNNWTGKQGPVQKHSQLNHSTVRSRKKKKMSRKINLSIDLMNKRRCKILLLIIIRQSWPDDNYSASLKRQYNEWWQIDRPTTPMHNTVYRALDKNLAIANKSRVNCALALCRYIVQEVVQKVNEVMFGEILDVCIP